MRRPPNNPVTPPSLRFSDPITTPTEQDVYATAHLGRAMANSAGHTTHNKLPFWGIMFQLQEQADMVQNMFLGIRRTT